MLVDEDSSQQLADGQMLKREFIETLEREVTAAANEELGPIWSALGCPYLEKYFAMYRGKPAAHGEAVIRKYTGSHAKSAAALIPLVVARVRQGVRQWVQTGEAPPEAQLFEPAAAQARRTPEQGRAAAKMKAGLGEGGRLDSTIASAVEAEYGHSLGHVRVHTGAEGASLASKHGSRAVAVGSDIAFASGAYKPNTAVGDALIAHELAHVVQQHGADPETAYRALETSGSSAHEVDADQAAGGLVARKYEAGMLDEEGLLLAHELAHVGEQTLSPRKTASEDTNDAAPRLLSRLFGGVVAAGKAVGDRVKPALNAEFSLQRCKDPPEPRKFKTAKPAPTGPATDKEQSSERFANPDAATQELFAGKKKLDPGAEGAHVRRIQQALIDNGFLATDHVTGEIDAATVVAIKAFQSSAKLEATGIVDATFMKALNEGFDDFTAYRDQAREGGEKNSELLKGTRELTSEDRKAIELAMNPATANYVPVSDGKGGIKYVPPTFKDEVDNKKFQPELELILDAQVTRQYNSMATGKSDAERTPEKLYDWKRLEDVGAVGKRETDVVFGDWARGGKVVAGTILFDRWESQDRDLKGMDEDEKMGRALWRVQKIINEVTAVDDHLKKHGALATREAAQIEIVKTKIAKKRHDELLDIHRNWPAAAGEGEIFLQRWKKDDDEGNRTQMWKVFQSVIHEYIHTLCHDGFSDYYAKIADPMGHTLREGMTDLFTKIVWANVPFTESLRKSVEGPYYKADGSVPELDTYNETAEAEQIVAIAGIRNAYAAYFLGKAELLGKK